MNALKTSLRTLVALITLLVCLSSSWGLSTAEEGGGELSEYLKVAEKGDVDAQSNLGLLYYNGLGVPQDYAEAAKWFRKSADQGSSAAQYYLGLCYRNGKGVIQDDSKAVKWFCFAADQGNPNAQNSLGVCYSNGEGVIQDYVLAYMWSDLASASGIEGAQNREAISKRMTPEQIAKAQELSREWKPKGQR